MNKIAVSPEIANEVERVSEQLEVVNESVAPPVDISGQDIDDISPRYYIVMGVYKGIESAQKITQRLLDEGFHQTAWLERPDRIDVYAASFTDENAAKVYLKEVHKKFPRHTDAWILKK